jgi:hypothetical protein
MSTTVGGVEHFCRAREHAKERESRLIDLGVQLK